MKMRIEKVSYQKTFSIGPYLTDKVGVEISLDEGDDMHSVLHNARNLVDHWHKEANPHLYNIDRPIPQPIEDSLLNKYLSTPKEKNIADEKIEILIDNSKTLQDLAELKPKCTTNELIKLYMDKIKSLTK
jgi:hypothetical protein